MKSKPVLLFCLFFLLLIPNCQKTKPVLTTIRWWHINSDKPSQETIALIANKFEEANPDSKINITVLENMEYKPKLELEFAGKNPPDIFHSWGSGGMIEMVKKGYLKDITEWVMSDKWESKINPVALGLYSYKNRVYGFPHDLGAVGFWYNQELLSKAGFKEFPEDWDEYLEMLMKLKAQGITPIAISAADRWPVMYYWVYFAMRIGGADLFTRILNNETTFNDPAMIQAAKMLQDLNKLDVFQATYLGDDFHSQSRYVGDEICAMQLMGQWAIALQEQVSESKDLNSPKMNFAPFPAIKGTQGKISEAMGGGNGFVISAKAPEKAVELLEFFTRPDNQKIYFESFPAIPTVPQVVIKSSGLNQVKTYLSAITSFCVYPDQMFPLTVGTALNETSARLLLGELTPEEGCELIQNLWQKAQ